MWRCRIVGKINTIDNKIARVNRVFDGSKWRGTNDDILLRNIVMEEFSKRKDKGYPWRGDAVTVITLTGKCYEVYIPWDEENE